LSSLMWAFLTLFVFLIHHISLFAILSVNSRAYAHPLHECSKYRKGVDQIDLYLASGLGTSQDKIPKKTKCETLVDWVLNTKILFSRIPYPLSCTQTPFGDIRVTDSESSCTFCSFVACVNANIDSCLLRLELNCMLWLLYLKVLLWLCGMSPQKLCLLSFTYSRTSRN
jgi:hypothetical protein